PDHGLPYLVDLRRAVRETAALGVIAADRPSQLNLLREKPTVMLPYGNDREQQEHFLAIYRPDALFLTIQPPLQHEAAQVAAAWRSGALGPEWKVGFDSGSALLMVRVQPTPVP